MTNQRNAGTVSGDELDVQSVAHAHRALLAAAAAWADVLAASYPPSGRETAGRALRRQLELEFRKAVGHVESRAPRH